MDCVNEVKEAIFVISSGIYKEEHNYWTDMLAAENEAVYPS